MDDADRAAAMERQENQQLLQEHRLRPRLQPLIIDGEPCCRDCEEPISERLAAGVDACRCLTCQQRHEQKGKQYAR